MDDDNKLPKTFDEWERKAKRRLQARLRPASLSSRSFSIRVILAYYKAKNFSARGDRERNMFARASAKVLNLKRAASDRA
jgi:hypothetical protein